MVYELDGQASDAVEGRKCATGDSYPDGVYLYRPYGGLPDEARAEILLWSECSGLGIGRVLCSYSTGLQYFSIAVWIYFRTILFFLEF